VHGHLRDAPDVLESFDADRGGCLVRRFACRVLTDLELQQRLKELQAAIPTVF
jgi:hypothetical protein